MTNQVRKISKKWINKNREMFREFLDEQISLTQKEWENEDLNLNFQNG